MSASDTLRRAAKALRGARRGGVLVDPTVGLALADWLEYEASRLQLADLIVGAPPALNVARAVLRDGQQVDNGCDW